MLVSIRSMNCFYFVQKVRCVSLTKPWGWCLNDEKSAGEDGFIPHALRAITQRDQLVGIFLSERFIVERLHL
ncbi:hypothetical protein A8140_02165 [Vibrio campbellii CAIM 519 = NBRC 15631 = ATCC 25920]|nr:hypothetical protein A8140_02165 [Vibrio campbellii CAIM 519 = NBRC 15631 = ATCC 25920]